MASTIKKPSHKHASAQKRAPQNQAEGFLAISSPAQEFCREHNLRPYLDLARRLISEFFTTSGQAYVSKEEDPEFDEQWVGIFVRVSGDADSVAAAYDQYIKGWAVQVPADVIGKIRLSIGAA